MALSTLDNAIGANDGIGTRHLLSSHWRAKLTSAPATVAPASSPAARMVLVRGTRLGFATPKSRSGPRGPGATNAARWSVLVMVPSKTLKAFLPLIVVPGEHSLPTIDGRQLGKGGAVALRYDGPFRNQSPVK